HDLNLRAAYLHVLADTLTSLLAIFALLVAKYYGWVWMDPIMGVVGAVLITKWSIGLLRQSGSVLLDQQGPSHLVKKITNRLTESPCGSQVVDLHVWSIGPNIFSTAIVVLSDQPQVLVPIKEALKDIPEIVHSTVEVHPTLQRDSEPVETPGNDFH
ncbi:MAG: cation diffusion facilitator family transporter, partial [Limisphaerales bacterium]